MSRLLYVANARIPTEKANGYQIVQMCEAFALAGEQVTLVVPRRLNTSDLRSVTNVWEYYGVRENFEIVYLPCLDLLWLPTRLPFVIQTVTFLVALLGWLPFQKYDRLFSRDMLVMAGLALVVPPHKLIYEVHSKARSGLSKRLQSWLLRRVRLVVSLTGAMAAQLKAQGANNIMVAHDGIRPERFVNLPSLQAARATFDLPPDAFIACYSGRLHTMGMSKGLDGFVDAAAKTGAGIHFLLVGGTNKEIVALRQHWLTVGLPIEHFHAVGTVAPADVPRYLAAADVCLITSPQNEFFANETSPMKLFEYMLAGKAILASDLASTREVVTHRESAYLVPPGNIEALAGALLTLKNEPELRQQLGQNAAQLALGYTWQQRAESILKNAEK